MNYGIEKFANGILVYTLESNSKDDIMRRWKHIKNLKRLKTVDVVFYLVEYRGCSIDDDITLDTFVPEEL